MYDTNSLVQKEAASQSIPTVFLEGAVTATSATDGVNGFIAPATAEGYAAKIESVLSDEAQYKRVAEGAKRSLWRSWDDAVEELKSEYRRLVDENADKKQNNSQ